MEEYQIIKKYEDDVRKSLVSEFAPMIGQAATDSRNSINSAMKEMTAEHSLFLEKMNNTMTVFERKVNDIVGAFKNETEKRLAGFEHQLSELKTEVKEAKSGLWPKKHLHVIYVTIITFAIFSVLLITLNIFLLVRENRLEVKETDIELIIKKHINNADNQ